MRTPVWIATAMLTLLGAVACGERPASGGDVLAGGACDVYAACCADYVAALARLDEYEREPRGASYDSCLAVAGVQDLPTGEAACARSLALLRETVVALESEDGWITPTSCR